MTLSQSHVFSSCLLSMSKGLIFHTQGMEESRSCHERPSAKIKLSDSLGLLWAHPSSSTCVEDVLFQSGGGPLVYLSMGWNDRAKLLERAQL